MITFIKPEERKKKEEQVFLNRTGKFSPLNTHQNSREPYNKRIYRSVTP
jgi:hypothetical protein